MRGRLRREPRLDPVRWRRPGRSVLLRSAVVAILLVTAALVLWTGPWACEPSCPTLPGPASSAPGSASSVPGPASSISGPASSVSGPASSVSGPLVPAPAARGDPADGVVPATGRAARRAAVPPGFVGVPIRLAEPAALKLIHPGDHVDVFRVAAAGGSPQAVATAALVLEVTGADDPGSGGLLLALTPAAARRTVTTPGDGYAVLIRPDG